MTPSWRKITGRIGEQHVSLDLALTRLRGTVDHCDRSLRKLAPERHSVLGGCEHVDELLDLRKDATDEMAARALLATLTPDPTDVP